MYWLKKLLQVFDTLFFFCTGAADESMSSMLSKSLILWSPRGVRYQRPLGGCPADAIFEYRAAQHFPHDGHRQAKKENSTITAEALVAGYMDLHLEKGRVFGWLTLSLACLAGKRHFSLVMLRWTCGIYDIVGWSHRAKLKMALGRPGHQALQELSSPGRIIRAMNFLNSFLGSRSILRAHWTRGGC